MSPSELVIELGIWIDKARARTPYDADLVNDLWYMRDIVDGVAGHRKKKKGLMKRIAAFDQTESIVYLRKLLEGHYGKT